MKTPPLDLTSRRPVWLALSEMFLDTDTSLSRDWRARELAASRFSLEELEAILVDEVYPVCRANLLSIAGEWAGFDQSWLEQRITRRLSSPFRFLHAINLGRLTVHASGEWRETKRAVTRIRSGNEQSEA